MTSTSVTIKDHRDYRRLEAIVDGDDVAGFAQYEIGVDGTFDFFHTEVDERFAGEGVGSQLAAGVVEFARSEGVKIRPTCDFLQSYLEEHEDARDVVAEEEEEEPRDENAEEEEPREETAELGSEADEPDGEEADEPDSEDRQTAERS